MILCDTGPLVALIDRNDQHHARYMKALAELPPHPLLVTWPCMAEAMYLLGRAGGAAAQDELWSFLLDGLVVRHHTTEDEWMRGYRDLPMDLADASLVTAAEQIEIRQAFILDGRFRVYRMHGNVAVDIVP